MMQALRELSFGRGLLLWDALAVIYVGFLVTHFVLSQSKFR